MPQWLLYLIDFLKGFIPSALKAAAKETAVIQAHEDKGAADQRKAEDDANAKLETEAGKLADDIAGMSQSELNAAADPFRVRPPP